MLAFISRAQFLTPFAVLAWLTAVFVVAGVPAATGIGQTGMFLSGVYAITASTMALAAGSQHAGRRRRVFAWGAAGYGLAALMLSFDSASVGGFLVAAAGFAVSTIGLSRALTPTEDLEPDHNAHHMTTA